jgi:hypothetical protein
MGPFSWEKVRQFVASGRLSPGDLVWREGSAKAVPARAIKGLFPEPDDRPAAEENDAAATPDHAQPAALNPWQIVRRAAKTARRVIPPPPPKPASRQKPKASEPWFYAFLQAVGQIGLAVGVIGGIVLIGFGMTMVGDKIAGPVGVVMVISGFATIVASAMSCAFCLLIVDAARNQRAMRLQSGGILRLLREAPNLRTKPRHRRDRRRRDTGRR